MRLSRGKKTIVGSLRGLSSKEYYAISEFKNPVPLARKYLPENIYTKFNRQKPLSPEQAQMVFDALNKAAFDQTKDLIPTLSPHIKLRAIKRVSAFKSIYDLSINMVRLQTKTIGITKYYFVSHDPITYKGKSSIPIFTKHSIERIQERSGLLEYCQVNTMLILTVMRKSVQDSIIEIGVNQVPQLKFGPVGYCPMDWDETGNCWVLTTFLERSMRGTAEENTIRVKQALKDLSSKYEVEYT